MHTTALRTTGASLAQGPRPTNGKSQYSSGLLPCCQCLMSELIGHCSDKAEREIFARFSDKEAGVIVKALRFAHVPCG